MKKIFSLILWALCISSSAQDLKYYQYDTDLLTKEFHQGRRLALRNKMPDNSVAVLFANPQRNRANDVDYQYHQDPNFYYLTGFLEPNSMLMVFKSPQTLNGITADEFLFVPDRNPAKELWTGRRAGRDGAMKLTGMKGVFLINEFDSLNIDFKKFDNLLYKIPKGLVNDPADLNSLNHLVEVFKKKNLYPRAISDNQILVTAMAELREIKTPEEIMLMRKAIEMSCQGHIEIMKTLKPGMNEYDVQAIGEYVFKRHGSEYIGYGSICGGGENSCILHYTSNRRPLKSGDVQLNDMGAEYHGYTADVTRTIPVNGKFSPEQKIIYELVLKAQEAGIEACLPENEFTDPHKAASEVITKGLLELGIIKEEKELRKYFMHGTSHYLGLDVHDAGTRGKLKEGVVLTVEPGIYIAEGSPCDPKWWNIGVRIEDDILITKTGYENLSVSAPRTVEAIEATMKLPSSWIKEDK